MCRRHRPHYIDNPPKVLRPAICQSLISLRLLIIFVYLWTVMHLFFVVRYENLHDQNEYLETA